MVKSPLLRSAKMPMLELILVIGYFAVISVLILQLFLSANTLQNRAKDEGKAIIQSEKIAEMIKAADSFEAAKKECNLSEYSKEDGKNRVEKYIINMLSSKTKETMYAIHFDKDWKECTADAMYTMVIVPSVNMEFSPNMEEYDIYVYRLHDYVSLLQQQNEEDLKLYQLQFAKYRR